MTGRAAYEGEGTSRAGRVKEDGKGRGGVKEREIERRRDRRIESEMKTEQKTGFDTHAA
jgi:hypothetical protein